MPDSKCDRSEENKQKSQAHQFRTLCAKHGAPLGLRSYSCRFLWLPSIMNNIGIMRMGQINQE